MRTILSGLLIATVLTLAAGCGERNYDYWVTVRNLGSNEVVVSTFAICSGKTGQSAVYGGPIIPGAKHGIGPYLDAPTGKPIAFHWREEVSGKEFATNIVLNTPATFTKAEGKTIEFTIESESASVKVAFH